MTTLKQVTVFLYVAECEFCEAEGPETYTEEQAKKKAKKADWREDKHPSGISKWYCPEHVNDPRIVARATQEFFEYLVTFAKKKNDEENPCCAQK